MTVHRPDPQCNTNEAATATIPANVAAANTGLLARREERARERAAQHAAECGETPDLPPQSTEPKPILRTTQSFHENALSLQERTGCHEPQKPKPLPVKKPPLPATAEESVVAEMIGSGNNARRAVVAALAFTMKHRHGIQTGEASADGEGFGANGEFQPEECHARAFTFVRVLLHAPTFASCRGHGCAFVDRLATALGDEGLDLLAVKLGCVTEDLVRAAKFVRTLLGENMRAVAALAMDRVVIPPHVLVHIRHFSVVLSVVKLVAALAEVHGKRDGAVFVSISDATKILGKDRGSIAHAFSIAVERGALELVSRGHRKHATAPGLASEYRVPWIMAK